MPILGSFYNWISPVPEEAKVQRLLAETYIIRPVLIYLVAAFICIFGKILVFKD